MVLNENTVNNVTFISLIITLGMEISLQSGTLLVCSLILLNFLWFILCSGYLDLSRYANNQCEFLLQYSHKHAVL